jgi:phosphoglycerate dehydrogenase-like enzyme
MSNKPLVILDPQPRRMDEVFWPADLDRLHAIVDVVWGKDDIIPDVTLRQALPDVQMILCGSWRYGDILDQAPRLRAILEVGGGPPRGLDYEACYRRGIRVLSCAPAFGPQVAEMSLGLALAVMRQVVASHESIRAGTETWGRERNPNSILLAGKPVGIIGYGSLSRSLLPLLAPFGCPVSVYDPWLSDGYLRSEGVTPLPLEPLLAQSQVIFVMAIPTPGNRALLSRSMLERIRPDAALCVISRAHLVDFDALTEMLYAGRFRAAIDVFAEEPLPLDHPIRKAPNVVLTAHFAGSTTEGRREIGTMVVDDLEAIVQNLPPRRMLHIEPELVSRYFSR